MGNNPSFEDALAELEEIVSRLETGDLALEESLSLFERGQTLAALCNQALDQAELRLEQIGSSPMPLDSTEE